jgi:membrane associated rhomboid family serine protease
MPLAPQPDAESVSRPVEPDDVREFRKKAVLYSLGTIAGLAFWIANRRSLPLEFVIPILGGAAIEAVKNIKRWREWRNANPGPRGMHPDVRRALEQETVRILSDAAKARAWYTRGLIILITVPSALQLISGVEHSVAVASVDPEAIRRGETWRLLSGTYLHGSFFHYFSNMSALLVYGSILEMKDARLRVPLAYLLSALGGAVASVLIPPDVPSVGASGGIVGLIGYLFLLSRRQAIKFPPLFRGATASILLGLFTAGALGFWYIDNPGHAGGALAGFIVAAIIVDPARNYGEDLQTPLLDLLGWIAIAILVGGAVVTSSALLVS